MIKVPVISKEGKPLMPTTASRAKKFIKSRKATYFWNKGIFCIRMNVKTETHLQDVAVGVDPGSKKEGFSVVSENSTYLNLQVDAVTWVKNKMETRKNLRKSRRGRKCPYRICRLNRKNKKLPPSVKARWQLKLRVLNWLKEIYPITDVVVENIRATTKKGKKWNIAFSPLQIGKEWFYSQVEKFARLTLYEGYQTAELRKDYELVKIKDKMSNKWEAHCVDAWVLAAEQVGSLNPDNKKVICLTPIRFYYRQLHVTVPVKGGVRRNYGGTRSMGLRRGTLVNHPKWGIAYVGGASNNYISLHNIKTGKRVTRKASADKCKILSNYKWRLTSH